MEEKSKTNRRRRERAIRLKSEILESCKVSDDSCEEALIRSKPPRIRKKNRDKEPLFEENVLDGFAILSFKTYEDLERCVRSAEKIGSHYLDPSPGRVKEIARKKIPIIRKNGHDSSNSSSEQGYFCDNEDEKGGGSDDDSDFFSASTKSSIGNCITTAKPYGVPLKPGLLRVRESVALTKPALITTSDAIIYKNGQLESVNYGTGLHSGLRKTHLHSFDCASSNKPIINDNKIKKEQLEEKPKFLNQEQWFDRTECDYENFKCSKPYISPRESSLQQSTSHSTISCPKFPQIINPSPIPHTPSTTVISTISYSTSAISSTYNCNKDHDSVCRSFLPTNGSLSHTVPATMCSSSNLGKHSVVSLVSDLTSNDVHNSNYVPRYPSVSTSAQYINPQTTNSTDHKMNVVAASTNSVNCKTPTVSVPSYNSYHDTNSMSQTWPYSVPASASLSPQNIKKEPKFESVPQTMTSLHNKFHLRNSIDNFKSLATLAQPTPTIYSERYSHSTATPGSQPGVLHPLNCMKSEPGLAHRGFLGMGTQTTTSASPRPPVLSLPTIARHSPVRHSPRSHETALHGLCRPSSNIASSNLNPLSSLPRPGMPPVSFPSVGCLPGVPHTSSAMFAPPLPNSQPIVPPSLQLAQDPLVQVDLLRRELDSRFLAAHDRNLGIGAPSLAPLGTVPVPTLLRTDVHHHQHQHTHVHQHLIPPPHLPTPAMPSLPAPAPTGLFTHSAAPSLFKEVNKTAVESSVYHPHSKIASSYSGVTLVNPQNSTQFVPPSHMSGVTKKCGIWNAMHVRLAWEIYYDQQKRTNEKSFSAKLPTAPPSNMNPLGPSQVYSSLPRPPDLSQHLGSSGSSHRMEQPFGSHMSPSLPRLSGFRYDAGNHSPSASSLHHLSFAPTSMSGPPPGSMFSRDPVPSGVGLPLQNTAYHDTWRLRTPSAFGPGSERAGAWPSKQSLIFERDRMEQEEKMRREKEEREKNDIEERERKEREEAEKKEKERRDRERERRNEHEKERLARLADIERQSGAYRRDESRSPINRRSELMDSTLVNRVRTDPARAKPADSSKDDVMIVGSKDGTHQPSFVHPPSHIVNHSFMLPHSASYFPRHSHSLPTHFSSAAASSASSINHSRPLPSLYQGGMAHPPSQYSLSSNLSTSWTDPFNDPCRAAAVIHDPLNSARAHDLAACDALREQISIDRAREEHYLRTGSSNHLNPLVWNGSYREHQAREMIDRERELHMAGAAAAASRLPPGCLYPPTSVYLPPGPSHISSILPSIKTNAALGQSLPPGLHPQTYSPLHPGASHLSLGLAARAPPPSLLNPVRAPPSLSRPLDKKESR